MAVVMAPVRFGVIGLGAMGRQHARAIGQSTSDLFRLTAVADTDPRTVRQVSAELAVPGFTCPQQLLDSGRVDVVLIAVPHYLHAPVALRAARSGVHVLCEKPLAVEIDPARQIVSACKACGVTLGAMLQCRRKPFMVRLKRMIDDGELGEIRQANVVSSRWYRTQAYYDSGGWRGTWAGEGGGVLTNQAPHDLDAVNWLLGSPQRIAALLTTRVHDIEVENTANVLCDHGVGRASYLYFSTAESPRREQIVIYGDKGVVRWDGTRLVHGRLDEPLSRHVRTCPERLADHIPEPPCRWSEIALPPEPADLRLEVVEAFARHLLDGTPLVATGQEAAQEVELANAIYLAGFGRRMVELPLGADEVREMRRLLGDLAGRSHANGKIDLRAIAAAEMAALQQERAGRTTREAIGS